MDQQFLNGLSVMEPISLPEPLIDPDFIYQVKWDGVRMLAAIDRGKITLINRRQHVRTAQYPELQELAHLVSAADAVLDGEVIVLKDGKPSFPAVLSRDNSSTRQAIAHLSQLMPATYMVFDLLYLNGESLMSEPLVYRSAQLSRILHGDGVVNIVEDFRDGKALFEGTRVTGLEGIVAKNNQSNYQPGKKHRSWFKIKHQQSLYCLVGGYSTRNGMVNSLLLGIYQDSKLLYIGKASTGLTGEQKQIITEQLRPITISVSPFNNLNSSSKNTTFVQPLLVVLVSFLEWTEQLSLRSPVIKGFATVNPRDCTLH